MSTLKDNENILYKPNRLISYNKFLRRGKDVYIEKGIWEKIKDVFKNKK